MKKVCSILLALGLLLVCLPAGAVSAASIVNQSAVACVAEGENVVVTIDAAGDGLTYTWYWAKAGATKFSVTNTFKGNEYYVAMTADRDGRRVYCVVTDSKGNKVQSDTFTLTMHAYDYTCSENCNICGEERQVDSHVYDNDEDTDCNVCGDVRVVEKEILYGDANADGAVNARDAALLQQHVAGSKVTMDVVAADANGDGAVNARDAALLQQYVAGWNVDLDPNKVYNDGNFGSWD